MENNVDLLLLEIQEAVSCSFISKLHTSAHIFDSRARALIARIPDERYSLHEWNLALSYITGVMRTYPSIQEVKERFNHMT